MDKYSLEKNQNLINSKAAFWLLFLFYGIKLNKNFTFTKKCNIMDK